jgi:hypothetical protein
MPPELTGSFDTPTSGPLAGTEFKPYYNAVAGAEVLDSLQKLEKERLLSEQEKRRPRDLTITYSSSGLRPQSLYMKVSNGWRWIINNIDKDSKYKHLRSYITLQREMTGVVFKWRVFSTNTSKSGDFGKADETWKDKVQEWLEDEEQDLLELNGISFGDEGMDWVKGLLSNLSGIKYMFEHNNTTLRIVKPFNSQETIS